MAILGQKMDLTTTELLEAVGCLLGHGLVLIATDGSVVASSRGARDLFPELESLGPCGQAGAIPLAAIVAKIPARSSPDPIPFQVERDGKPAFTGSATLIEGPPPMLLMAFPPTPEESGYLGAEVLSILNHEFRTPLATLSGFAELMLHRDFDAPTTRSFLSAIRGESARLARLFQNLIDLQRLRARSFSLHIENLDFNSLLKEACDSQLRTDPERHVEIRLPRRPVPVQLDRAKVMRALEILLDSAFKLSDGANRVETRLRATKRELVASITVAGSKIPPAAIGVLFDADYRPKETSWPQFDCFSLPLAKAIVEAHRGRIWADSDPARGSILSFRLPRTTVA